MNQELNQGPSFLSQTKSRSTQWLQAHPRTNLALQVGVQIAGIAAGAFIGYKAGKKDGVKQGEIKGYASALSEIGVAPAEVPTLTAAWRESNLAAKEAMQALQTAAA